MPILDKILIKSLTNKLIAVYEKTTSVNRFAYIRYIDENIYDGTFKHYILAENQYRYFVYKRDLMLGYGSITKKNIIKIHYMSNMFCEINYV